MYFVPEQFALKDACKKSRDLFDIIILFHILQIRIRVTQNYPNMKKLTIVITAIFFLASAFTKINTPAVPELNGSWRPVKQSIGGNELPATLFQSQKLIIQDSNYVLEAESVDKGILQYKNGRMDIYGKQGVNKGKHFTAIYKLENEELSICYNLSGDSYPTSFETKGKPTFFLSVFKKEQDGKE